MKLYHGSDNGDIKELKPILSNHNKPYVYLITNKALAVMYAYNALPRPNGFFTYGFNKDGTPYYDEYFEGQLEKLYKGKSGYLYEFESEKLNVVTLPQIKGAYVSEEVVKTNTPIFIEDIYEEMLKLEKEGLITINRYNEASESRKLLYKKIIQNEIENKELKENLNHPYAEFLHEHFPDLI